jgi:hypothetical protein
MLPDCQVQYQALIHDGCFWAWTFPFSPKYSQLMHQHLQLAVKYNQITETYSHYTTAVVWQMQVYAYCCMVICNVPSNMLYATTTSTDIFMVVTKNICLLWHHLVWWQLTGNLFLQYVSEFLTDHIMLYPRRW